MSQPVEEEMETAENETGNETVSSSHSSQEQPGKSHKSSGKLAELPVLYFYCQNLGL